MTADDGSYRPVGHHLRKAMTDGDSHVRRRHHPCVCTPTDRVLILIGDLIIPPLWRGKALDIYGKLSTEPSDDDAMRGQDLIDASALYRQVWKQDCSLLVAPRPSQRG